MNKKINLNPLKGLEWLKDYAGKDEPLPFPYGRPRKKKQNKSPRDKKP